MRSALAFVLVVLAVSTPGAQVRDRAAAAVAAPPSDATLLARGWTALANGQPTEAASAAAQLLARVPWHHGANALRIEALSASDPMKGLDASEAWLTLPQRRRRGTPGARAANDPAATCHDRGCRHSSSGPECPS